MHFLHNKMEMLVRLLTEHQQVLFRYVFCWGGMTSLAISRRFADCDAERPFLPWAYQFVYLKVLSHREMRKRPGLVFTEKNDRAAGG